MKRTILLLLATCLTILSNAQDFSSILSPDFQNSSTLDKLIQLSELKQQKKINSDFAKQYGSRLLFVLMTESFRDSSKLATAQKQKVQDPTLKQFEELDKLLFKNRIQIDFEPSTYNYPVINALLKKMRPIKSPVKKYELMYKLSTRMILLSVLPSYSQVLAVENINKQIKNPILQLDGLKEFQQPTNKSLERYFFYKHYEKRFSSPNLDLRALNKALMELEQQKKISAFGAARIQRDIVVWMLIRDQKFMSLSKENKIKHIEEMQTNNELISFAKDRIIRTLTEKP